ncbi:iron-sulfur cluster co-chaperone protein HscB [Microcaecilia unicolor]|uniref:Iron-sulfur cluster co-chaperone protein HscB n=1 Tax=Microcaecilia unicolor TaxID=1415580 RepID=A0A6P7ZCF0_9AMPH|nr:iron-sulfur cluster co-chaperone protein HscB [Microcaecilia unicolor]
MIPGCLRRTLCLREAWSWWRPGACLSRMTGRARPGPAGKRGARGQDLGARRRLNCWSCQRPLLPAHVFCPSCNVLQPPDAARDYFDIMDCDRSFNIDIQKLQQEFRDLQRSLHPDYYSQKSQKERELSEKQSSLVNKAYKTLLTPLSRGLYMLKLNGIELEEGTDSAMEARFLTEIMEMNEKLAEAHTEAEVQDIGDFVEAKLEELTEDVGKAFVKGDLQEAKMLLSKMQYFSNLVDKVKEKMIPS